MCFRRLFIEWDGCCRNTSERALSEKEQPSPNLSDSRVIRKERLCSDEPLVGDWGVSSTETKGSFVSFEEWSAKP